MSLFRTAEGNAHVGWTSSSAKVAVTQSELESKDAGASQAPAVWCHSLGLVTAAALEKLCPGCSGVTDEEESHLHSRQKEQEVTGSSCRAKDHQVLCCKGGKLQEDSHGSGGWRLPLEGSLEISASLAVLSRLHEPATVLLYTTLLKESKRQHGHYIGFVIIAVS